MTRRVHTACRHPDSMIIRRGGRREPQARDGKAGAHQARPRRHLSGAEVGVEEAEDPRPGVLGGRVVVAEAGHPLQDGEGPDVVPVHERVPGVGVLADVVRHPVLGEHPLQPLGRPAEGARSASLGSIP